MSVAIESEWKTYRYNWQTGYQVVKCYDPRTVGDPDLDLDSGSSEMVRVRIIVSHGTIYYGTVANSNTNPYHALWILQKKGDKYEYVMRVKRAHLAVYDFDVEDDEKPSRTISYIKNYIYEKVVNALHLRRQYVRMCARMLALVKRERATVDHTVANWRVWEMVFGSSDTSLPEDLQQKIVLLLY